MAAKTKIALDVTQLLHEDHQKVRELFFDFSASEDDNKKEQLVQEILMELYVHAAAEESIVYPVVKDEAEDGDDLIGEAEIEHRLVKFLMAEISTMNSSDEDLKSKVTVLCELVNHHVKEEEKEMFQKLRESGADLEDLAEQVQALKAELKAQGLPQMHASLSIGDEQDNNEDDMEEDDDDQEEEPKAKAKSKTAPKRALPKQKRKSA
jgi:hemerythrin superfamily protein